MAILIKKQIRIFLSQEEQSKIRKEINLHWTGKETCNILDSVTGELVIDPDISKETEKILESAHCSIARSILINLELEISTEIGLVTKIGFVSGS